MDTTQPGTPVTKPENPKTTLIARRRLDWRNSMLYRLSDQAKPLWLLGGMLTSTAAVGPLVEQAAIPAGVGLVLSPATTAAACGVMKLRSLSRGERRLPGRRIAAALAASCWCWFTAAAGGPDWETTMLLLGGGFTASLGWWRDHRLEDPAAPTPPPPPPAETVNYPTLWEKHNASQRGALPSSYLTSEQPIDTGLRYDLHLEPGVHTLPTALGALERLRSGLRLMPGQDAVVEEHPTADKSILRLTVVLRSKVLTVDQVWSRPQLYMDRGTIGLGPYIDGEGTAEWILFRNHRILGGFLVGSTGSGKSRQLECIALGANAAGVVIWWHDPQGGASSTMLTNRTDWSTTDTPGLLEQLRAAQKLKKLRQLQNAINGWEGWTPAQGRPGLLIVIDESHGPLKQDPEVLALAVEIAREGGKVGIQLLLCSQVPSIDAFGGDEALRSNIVSGNLLLMRVMSKYAKGILAGVSVDPSTFPNVAGYSYLVDSTGDRRSAPYRSFYLNDAARARADAETVWHSFDGDEARALGDRYGTRRMSDEARRRQAQDQYDRLVSGGSEDASSAAPAPSKIHQFPVWPLRAAAVNGFGNMPNGVVATQAGPPRTAVEAVYRLVADGVSSPGEMQERTGYSETSVRNALQKLAEEGRVVKPAGRASWTVADQPKAVAA